MDQDDGSLAARVFKDFQNIIHVPFDEYAIIPTGEQLLNKCPLVLVGNNLAIESWCLPSLFEFVVNEFNRLKQELSHETDTVSKILLMLNPDYATAWNVRRKLFMDHKTSLHEELRFSELLLKWKAKCPDNFSYRQFLLRETIKRHTSLDEQFIQRELDVCLAAAERHQKNYNAWSHRIWIIQNLCFPFDIPYELQRIEKWIWSHVSEYPAFHFRQFLIMKHSKESANILEFVYHERDMLDELFEVFPGWESLFLHRRFVAKMLQTNGMDVIPLEKEFIKCQRRRSPENDWTLKLAQRHERWIQKFLRSS